MWLLSNAPTRRAAEPIQRILVANEHVGTKDGHITTIHIAIRARLEIPSVTDGQVITGPVLRMYGRS
jgi:hypothetical protein